MRRWVAGVVGAVLLACEPLLAVPNGAVPFAPDRQQFIAWWREVEVCSGLRGDFDSVSFYLMPGAQSFTWGGDIVTGLWLEAGNRIVLAEAHANRAGNVRHEMLHALLKVPGHPREYFFQGVCDALVD
jgi:hypothetical protein